MAGCVTSDDTLSVSDTKRHPPSIGIEFPENGNCWIGKQISMGHWPDGKSVIVDKDFAIRYVVTSRGLYLSSIEFNEGRCNVIDRLI